MKKLALVAALGAALGSTLRYFVGQAIDSTEFPWATLTVNIAGSFLIGLVMLIPAIAKHDGRRVFIVTGVLGGFTTFSALAVEALHLPAQTALIYIVSSFVSGLVAVTIGYSISKKLS